MKDLPFIIPRKNLSYHWTYLDSDKKTYSTRCPLVLTLTGTFTIRIGQLLRQRIMTECRARQKMESVVRKIRLGWREYLLVTEGTTTVEGSLTRQTTVHKYTCTTYVHTARDLKKQSLDHGKTEGQYDARALRPYDEWLPPIDAIVLSPLPVSALGYIES